MKLMRVTNLAHTRYEIGEFCAEVAYSTAASNTFSLFFLSFSFYLFHIIDKLKKIYSVTRLQKHYTILRKIQYQ